MRKSKKGSNKVSRFEKLLYVVAIFLVSLSPLVIVFGKSTLSEVNYEVEKIKKEIKSQEKQNESLQMKINELETLINLI